jgi:uncharacterized protein YndB with AHSA1/START domain
MTHGTYDEQANALRFERRYAQPIERVWQAITEPDDLKQWFPDEVPDLSSATRDAPRLLEFAWGDEGDRLRFELQPDGSGTLLRFAHFLATEKKASRDAAGWHVCLQGLERLLDDWRALYEDYQARGFPAGAPVPDSAGAG